MYLHSKVKSKHNRVAEAVVEEEEEANLILQAMTMWPTQGCYWIN